MNVLSLFDGKSSGYTAMELAGLPITHYYSSEVDKYAIQVSDAIHPNQTRLGDITKWQEWGIDWSSIDLVLAGSPCQGFSFAGKQLAFDDPRSKLFFVFVDILNHIKSVNPQVKFLLENVKMKKEFIEVINEQVGEEPILINSALLSAQNRQRLYWSNTPIDMPEDEDIHVESILEHDFDKPNGDGWHRWWNEKSEFQLKKSYSAIVNDGSTRKAICMTARQFASWNGNFVRIGAIRGRYLVDGVRQDGKMKTAGKTRQYLELRDDSKTNTLTTVQKDNVVAHIDERYRNLTPRECFRLQTVPEHYIDKILSCGVSNSQLYKIAGNGWTDEVIAHILRQL